jgi:hypothetical protein
MTALRRPRSTARLLAACAGAAVGVYAAYAGLAWRRYGRATAPRGDEADRLLDRFMPAYDIAERHHVRVLAPAAVTLASARDMEMSSVPAVWAILKARDVILGSTPAAEARPRGLLREVEALGWVVLEEIADREVVVGAVTRPWEADVVFRPIPAAAFAAFDEPGYVKIAWTLRADPIGPGASIFRTETRAVATDATARRRFRFYWSLVSPGIVLIRLAMLGPVKAEAERRARATRGYTSAAGRGEPETA